MSTEKDYVLGTHDAELARLGLQHRVWRPRALDAWRQAGFNVGQALLDVGCGPGYAAIDLAEIVGPSGRVIAIDRSRRFLDALEGTCTHRGLTTVEAVELDLDRDELPQRSADGAWARWVFCFLRDPRSLLERIHRALRPGARLVIQEYLAYETWRFLPRLPEHDEFVQVVMESWRGSGGEPNVGLDLPRWLEATGFETKSLHPIIDVVDPDNYIWQWPRSFVDVGLRRLADLGRLTAERARQIGEAFRAREAEPATLLATPAVLQIIAERR